MAASAEELLEALMEFIIQGRTGMPPHPNDPRFGIGGSNLPSKKRGTRGATKSSSTRRGFTAAQIASVAPKKRKVSAYQKRFGIEMKRLIKAHPRTPRTRLMKRAHTATKRAMKK